MTATIVVAGIEIRHDVDGRFSLNDLHLAAGKLTHHSPSRWTRGQAFRALVAELKPEMEFAPAKTVRGGAAPGTYVCRELVYAYAMWISAAFQLKVIRAYDAIFGRGTSKRPTTRQRLPMAVKELEVSVDRGLPVSHVQGNVNRRVGVRRHGDMDWEQLGIGEGYCDRLLARAETDEDLQAIEQNSIALYGQPAQLTLNLKGRVAT